MNKEMEVKSPLELLWQWEQTKPNDVYLSQPKDGRWIDYTWQQVAKEVRAMAGVLQSYGFEPGSRIASLSKNDAYWIISDLAIMAAGYVSVPMYPNLNEKTVKQILEHSEAKAIFVGKLDAAPWKEMQPGIPENITKISTPLWGPADYDNWNDLTAKHKPIEGSPVQPINDLASIIYTSGTTGMPKGVMHKYFNFAFAGTHAVDNIDVIEGGKFFSYLPLCHIAERLLVEIGSIYSGGKVYFAESLDTFGDNLAHAQPHTFLAVPRIWDKFQQKIWAKMPQKKLNRFLKIPILNGIVKKKIRNSLGLTEATNVFSGAAPIPVSLVEWFKTIDINIQEAYAMTENCCYSHVTRSNNIKIGSVGQPLKYVDVKISEEGEILVKHDALMDGYYKEPEKTAETLVDGYLRTGDQGRIDNDGFLYITGRVKDLFKTDKGKYIAPAPIELSICGNPYVEQCVLIGNGIPMPIALLTLSEEGLALDNTTVEKSLADTRTELNPKLDHHEHVQTFVVLKEPFTVENGLLTPTLKIKRNLVEKKYMDNFKGWYKEEDGVVFQN